MQYFGHVPPLVGFISSVVRERKEGRKRGGGLNNNDLFTDCKKRRDPIFISLTQQEAVHQPKKKKKWASRHFWGGIDSPHSYLPSLFFFLQFVSFLFFFCTQDELRRARITCIYKRFSLGVSKLWKMSVVEDRTLSGRDGPFPLTKK